MPISTKGRNYQVTVQHNHQRFQRTFSDRESAEVWELRAKADLKSGDTPDLGERRNRDSRPRTVEQCAWYTYRTVWAGTKSDDKSQININQIIEAFGGDTLISRVDVRMIDAAVDRWKSRGNANGTINRKLSCLSKILSKAQDIGAISSKPKITKMTEDSGRIRWFTDDEKRSIYAALPGRHSGIARVLMETGLRCGELFRLTPADIQGDLIVLSDTKNAWPRSVPMTPAVREVIHEEIRLMEDGQETLFGWTKYAQFYHHWKKMQVTLGWTEDSEATAHACRHTFITNLVQKEVPISVVQQLAGHKCIRMTQRYTHLGSQDVNQYMDRLTSVT
ncbi:MAG: putative integrase [Prokaryotic dsDNA virus sp.]|nr:MAG: putative integrase [Prokaryotic dsDNA virus sp.]|tara:strand:- start:25801 stop:26802 length:1002 start_codon:yes stop_codon:yes gene_type:complete